MPPKTKPAAQQQRRRTHAETLKLVQDLLDSGAYNKPPLRSSNPVVQAAFNHLNPKTNQMSRETLEKFIKDPDPDYDLMNTYLATNYGKSPRVNKTPPPTPEASPERLRPGEEFKEIQASTKGELNQILKEHGFRAAPTPEVALSVIAQHGLPSTLKVPLSYKSPAVERPTRDVSPIGGYNPAQIAAAKANGGGKRGSRAEIPRSVSYNPMSETGKTSLSSEGHRANSAPSSSLQADILGYARPGAVMPIDQENVNWSPLMPEKAMAKEQYNLHRSLKEQEAKRNEGRPPISGFLNPTEDDWDRLGGENLQTKYGPFDKHQRLIGDAAIKTLQNHTPFVSELSPVVDPDELTHLSRELLSKSGPNTPEAIERREKLSNILYHYATNNNAANAVQPYLDRMSQNPAERHQNLFGDMEKNLNDTIYNRGTREFNEKILPRIMNNYQTPGLRRHGQQAKDIAGAGEKFARGLQEEASKSNIALRNMFLTHGGNYGALQGKAAETAQKAASVGRENELTALDSIDKMHQGHKLEEAHYMKNVANAGHENTQIKQALRKHRIDQARSIHNHPLETAKTAFNMFSQLPNNPNQSEFTGNMPTLPNQNTNSSTMKDVSKVLGGFSNQMLPGNQRRKTGGRVHKAIGGQVNPMQDVIQNAVIDKIDPVTELRRMLQHSQGMQGLQGRQQLSIGGSVDPIKAGAEDARMYAGHDAMKNKLHRLRNPEKRPLLNNIMGGIAAGFKDQKHESPFSGFFQGFNASDEYLGKQRESDRAGINEADDLEYKLQQKLEEKAMKEREAARQDALAASTIEHQRMGNLKIGHEMKRGLVDGLHPDDIPRAKLTPTNEKIIEEASSTVEAAAAVMNRVTVANEALQKIPTDAKTGFMASIPGIGPDIAAGYHKYLGRGDKNTTTEQYEDALKKEEAALAATKHLWSAKGKYTNAMFAADKSAKISASSRNETNAENKEMTVHEARMMALKAIADMERNNASRNDIRRALSMIGATEEELRNPHVQASSQQPAQPSVAPSSGVQTPPQWKQMAAAKLAERERAGIQ